MRISDWSSDVCSSDLYQFALVRTDFSNFDLGGGAGRFNLAKRMIMFLRLNRSAANRAVTVALQAEKKSCLLNSLKTRDVAFIDLHQLCETLERYRYIVRSLLHPTDRLDKSFLLNETDLRRIAGERELPFQLSKLCLQGLQDRKSVG